MKTLKKVNVETELVSFMPPYENMKEQTIYVSEEYRTAIHKCLCGCGSKTITPLNAKTGWYHSITNDKITLTPSIGNFNFPCQSHYIITNGVANFV